MACGGAGVSTRTLPFTASDAEKVAGVIHGSPLDAGLGAPFAPVALCITRFSRGGCVLVLYAASVLVSQSINGFGFRDIEHRQEYGDLFADAELVFVYTRAQVIADGVLIDVSEMAGQADLRYPVALTAALWSDIHAISAEYGGIEDVPGRLWDVLFMTRMAAQQSTERDISAFLYSLCAAYWRKRKVHRQARLWTRRPSGAGNHPDAAGRRLSLLSVESANCAAKQAINHGILSRRLFLRQRFNIVASSLLAGSDNRM